MDNTLAHRLGRAGPGNPEAVLVKLGSQAVDISGVTEATSGHGRPEFCLSFDGHLVWDGVRIWEAFCANGRASV